MGTKTHQTELKSIGSVFYFAVAACHQSFHPATATFFYTLKWFLRSLEVRRIWVMIAFSEPRKKKARGKTGGRAPIDCWLESMRQVNKRNHHIRNTRKTQRKLVMARNLACPYPRRYDDVGAIIVELVFADLVRLDAGAQP